MSRAFFGNIMSSLETTISTTAVSASKNAVTSSISTAASNTGGGTLTYSWQTTGNNCTVNTSSSSSTTVTGGGVAGTSNLFCNITNSANNTTYSSPSCIITWNPSTSIISVTWSIASATTSAYNGAAQSVTVSSINPAAATYSLATTPATNAGSIASTILTGTVDYDGTFTSPNLTIGTSTITLASSGSTSFAFNGAAQTVAYTVSGVYAADTNYSVSGTSATNCNNYTVTLSETSSNYTLGTSTFGWAITPTPPGTLTASVASYSTITFSWTAIGGCTYQLWISTDNTTYTLLTNNITGTTTNYNGPSNTTRYYYVLAVAPSGTSSRSRIAQVNVGVAAGSQTLPWDSGLSSLNPLCLSGSASGVVGLKAWPQGTYGIVVQQIVANNATLNGNFSSLLWGTATRTIRWNLNGTAVNFPRSTDTSAPAPWNSSTTGLAPYGRNIPAGDQTGTVTYSLVATGTGWATNNSGGLSGSFWATVVWRNTGQQTTTTAAVEPTVSYIT